MQRGLLAINGGLFKKMEDAQAQIKRDSELFFNPVGCGKDILTKFVQLSLQRVCISRHLSEPLHILKTSLLESHRPAYYNKGGIIKD